MTYTIKLRRDVASDWASVNPILSDGEAGFEIDTNRLKIGDGTSHWNDLEYLVGDIDLSLYAPLASPEFTGLPTAPTPTAGDDSTKLATTEFVAAAIDAIDLGSGGDGGGGSPHVIQAVVGVGGGGVASVFNQPASSPFTVGEACDITAVKISVPASVSLSAGTQVGIASDWNGSSTIPWLGHGSILAQAGPSDQTIVLDVTVHLVPGVTYRLVTTDGHASCVSPTYTAAGVVASFGAATYIGSTFATLRTDHAIGFSLIGPVTVFSDNSDAVGIGGALVSQAWEIATDGAQEKRLTWLTTSELQVAKNGIMQRIAQDFYFNNHSLQLLDDMDVADGDFVEAWYTRSPVAPEIESVTSAVTILNDSLHNAFPGFAMARNGDYVVSFRSSVGHILGVGSIKVARSSDRGATWSITTIYTGTDDFRDPVISQTKSGMFITGFDYTGSVFPGLRVFRSTDEGFTWTQVAHITGGAIYTASSYASSAPIIDGPNGELLWPTYGLDTGDTVGRLKVLVSLDAGVTWTQRATMYSGSVEYVEPNMCMLDDGRLFMLIRSDTHIDIYGTHSDDGGVTWDAPAVVLPGESGKPAVLQMYGRIHVMFRVGGGGPLGYAYSDDGGTVFTLAAGFGGPNMYAYGAWADTGGAVPSAVYANEISSASNSDMYFRRVPVTL